MAKEIEKTEKRPDPELLEILNRYATLAEDLDPDAERNELCAGLPTTESGMAMRMKIHFAAELRYWDGNWYWYEGKRWDRRPDMPILLVKKAAELVLQELRYVRCGLEEDEDEVEKALRLARLDRVKFAKRFESFSTASAAVGFCRSYMVYSAPVFDNHLPSLINFQNGTYDLSKEQLRPHSSADNFLSCLPFSYLEGAECPRWLGFLNEVFGADAEVINFVRRFVGCTLLGGTTDDEYMIWLSGSGRNGKSTFLDTLANAFGHMSAQVPNNLILTKKNESHPTEIARLHNIRFAMSTDVDINSKIDDMQFKRLVTTGTATGRFMGKDFFDFPVTWKLWISVNSLPSTNDFSEAMWRRVIVVPFEHTFSDEDVDKDIKTDLKEPAEVSGIWSWMIGAAIEVKHNGFPLRSVWPEKVSNAVAAWRGDEDWFELFMAQRCIKDHTKCVTLKDLYFVYTVWADENKISVYSRKSFSHRVQMAGWKKDETNHIIGTRFPGLGLIRQVNED